jgi:hypothetical protein
MKKANMPDIDRQLTVIKMVYNLNLFYVKNKRERVIFYPRVNTDPPIGCHPNTL